MVVQACTGNIDSFPYAVIPYNSFCNLTFAGVWYRLWASDVAQDVKDLIEGKNPLERQPTTDHIKENRTEKTWDSNTFDGLYIWAEYLKGSGENTVVVMDGAKELARMSTVDFVAVSKSPVVTSNLLEGNCLKCGHVVKERMLFTGRYIGCMC